MANGHVPARTNSGSKSMSLSVAGLSEEELAEKGKDLASKCWNEDESFLGREKIAEWLGGMLVPFVTFCRNVYLQFSLDRDKIKKVALKYYMDFFDFTSLRLDHAFR
jgi:PH/SEC7 domain-containing protein